MWTPAWTKTFTKDELFEFIDKAGKATYAAGGKEVKSEREGFKELEYKQKDFYYRDSYTGHYRSRGTEVVRYKGKVVWVTGYGGGMIKGKEEYTPQVFALLKKALSADTTEKHAVRGPRNFTDGEWHYTYEQDGEIDEFSGYEEIRLNDETVFFHWIVGGVVNYEE